MNLSTGMTWISEYRRSLKMTEVEEIIDLIYFRPLAFLLVKLVYNTPVTPNNLTLAAIISGVTGGALFIPGLTVTTRIGAFFIMLFVILDCSDGQLARLKHNGTKSGRLLDGIADYIVTIGLYSGIAIGYSGDTAQPSYMIILLLISGVSIIMQDALVDLYRTRFLDIVLKRDDTFKEGVAEYREEFRRLKEEPGRWIDKGVILVYLVYSKVQGKFNTGNDKIRSVRISPDEYYRKNRLMVRLWVFIGPSAMRTSLIICSFLERFDIFFWITIGAFNFLALVFWLIQLNIDRSLLPGKN